jgi:hypothetical protein
MLSASMQHYFHSDAFRDPSFYGTKRDNFSAFGKTSFTLSEEW